VIPEEPPPVTDPDTEPTEAIMILPLLQVPPLVTSFKLIVAPEQTVAGPVIAAGEVFTVIVAILEQPDLV